MSGGAARSGRGGGGEGPTPGDRPAPAAPGRPLRNMARRAREAAGEIRRRQAGDEQRKRLERLAEELAGFGRRLRPGELDRLAKRALEARRASPDEAARTGQPLPEAPGEARASRGPLGPRERARAALAADEEARKDEEGTSPEDLSRLSPEFRRLYEAYTRSISE